MQPIHARAKFLEYNETKIDGITTNEALGNLECGDAQEKVENLAKRQTKPFTTIT